jgi:hypothetical protein
MAIMSNKHVFFVKRRLSAEGIDFLDEERAINSLAKCVCGIALVRTYKEMIEKIKPTNPTQRG